MAEDDETHVDPQVAVVLERMRQRMAERGAIGSAPPSVMRQRFNEDVRAWNAQLPNIAAVVDRTCETDTAAVPVRIYDPDPDAEVLPCLVFLHGGGWVAGDLDTNERTLRILSLKSGVRVVSVDYPLAPEYPFPNALETCVAVARWVRAYGGEWGIDVDRVALGGDSAGGNLALAAALDLRDAGETWLHYLMLVYPALNPEPTSASYARFGSGDYGTGRDGMAFFWRSYLGDASAGNDPRANPLLADLTGLPPVDLVTAGLDPLTDDVRQLVRQLQETGVSVTHRHYEGVIHGFFSMSLILDVGDRAVNETAVELRAALFGTQS